MSNSFIELAKKAEKRIYKDNPEGYKDYLIMVGDIDVSNKKTMKLLAVARTTQDIINLMESHQTKQF